MLEESVEGTIIVIGQSEVGKKCRHLLLITLDLNNRFEFYLDYDDSEHF